MTSNILDRNEIVLRPAQEKLFISGWGETVKDGTITEKIIYNSGGIKVVGYLAYPREREVGKKYPCVMWNRGGYKKDGFIDEFTAKGIFGQIASWGYMVFASMYRGSVKGEGEDEFGGGDIDDIVSMMELADEIDFCDSTRWGMEGWSRGGYMSLNVLRRKKNISALILSGAITNLVDYAPTRPGLLAKFSEIFGTSIDRVIAERSPIQHIEELPEKCNYLLLHGGGDAVVPPSHSLELGRELINRGINCRLVIFEKGDHYLRAFRKETELLRKDWLKKYL